MRLVEFKGAWEGKPVLVNRDVVGAILDKGEGTATILFNAGWHIDVRGSVEDVVAAFAKSLEQEHEAAQASRGPRPLPLRMPKPGAGEVEP